MNKISLRLTCLSYLLIVFMVFYCFLTREVNMNILFNSDTMYLPAIFSDVFVFKRHFFSWYFTPAPYFFPDMPLYFIINAMVKNVFIGSLLFAIAQSMLALFLMSKIAYLVTRKNEAVLLMHIVFLLSLTFLVTHDIYPYLLMLISAFHFGSFINGLLLIWFIFLCYEKNTKQPCVALFLISALGAASDLFFLLLYVFPMIGSFLIVKKLNCLSSGFMKKIACVVFLGCFVGLLLKYSFVIDGTRSLLLSFTEKPWIKIHDLLTIFIHNTFLKNTVAGVLMLAFYATITVRCGLFFINHKKEFEGNSRESLIIFIHFFIVLSVILALINIIFSKLYVTRISISSFRYLINVYWLPIAFCWLPFIGWLEKLRIKKWMNILFFITLGLCVAEKACLHRSYQGEYYPEEVNCIDLGVKNYNDHYKEKIQYGIAGNWQAKLVTAFSKENISLVGLAPDLSPLLMLTTLEDYRNKYDFAVVDNSLESTRLNSALIEELNGKPVAQFQCGQQLFVMIYGQGKLKTVNHSIS